MARNDVWILAEQKSGRVLSVSFELLRRGAELARKLGCGLSAILLGHGIAEEEAEELVYHGADEVLLIDHAALADFRAEAYAAALVHLAREYHPAVLIAAATTSGRTVMPYAAVRLGAGLTADCTELDIEEGTGNLLQTRPAIGGNILATIKTPEARPQMATVRPRSSKPSPRDPDRLGSIRRVDTPDTLFTRVNTRYLGFSPDTTQEVAIQDAETVVAGGRGMGKAEGFEILRELAAVLGAAVGASRDVVDRGWIGYPHQVGLSGKTVSPRLYLACGISGAVQHVAGMQTAETIVAVNKDADAQIFSLADFGLVGDVNEILPVLLRRLRGAYSGGAKA